LKLFQFHFTDEAKLFPCGNQQEANQFLRSLKNLNLKQISWREKRPYLLIEKYQFEKSEENEVKQEGTLLLTGYLRGANLSANDLIHIPYLGDFFFEQNYCLSVSYLLFK